MEVLNTAMLGLVIFILGTGFFWGFVRKLYRTLLRFVTLLLALGCSYLFTKLFGNMVGRYIVSMLQPLLGDTVGSILSKNEMSLVADAVCEMIAAPFLFLAFYLILKVVFWIIYKICAVSMGVKGPRFFGRLTGAVAGLLCGFVSLVVFVTPMFGYITLANDALIKIAPDDKDVKELSSVLTTVTETPVAKEAYEFVGQSLFTGLTTVKLEEEKISLEQEVSAILSIFEDLQVLSGGNYSQFGSRETQAITKMAQDVGQSKIVTTVVATLLSDAAESWLSGQSALGMSKPDMGEDVQGVLDAFLTVFATSTSTTVPQDMNTFAEIFTILVNNELFSSGMNVSGFETKLVSIVGQLYDVLDKNPRMMPVKTAIRSMGVNIMMDYLGAGSDLRETHGEMLDDMANTLKNSVTPDGRIDRTVLSTGINDALKENNVTVDAKTTDLIAEAVEEYLTVEEIRTLAPEQLADKLAERFLASGDPLPGGITIPDGYIAK